MVSLNNDSKQEGREQQIDEIRRKLKKLCKAQKEIIPSVNKEASLKASKSDQNISILFGKLNYQNRDYLPVINPNR